MLRVIRMEMNYNPDFQKQEEEIRRNFYTSSCEIGHCMCTVVAAVVVAICAWSCDVFTVYSSCRMCYSHHQNSFGNLMLSMRNVQNEVGELCWFFSSRLFFRWFLQFVFILTNFCFLYILFFSLAGNPNRGERMRETEIEGDRERESEKKQNTDIFSYSIIWAWTTTFLCRGPVCVCAVLRCVVCSFFGQDDEWKSKWNFDSKYYHFLWQ